MASENTYDALKAHLSTAVGGSLSVYDWDQHDAAMEDSKGPFLALEEDFSQEIPVSVGSPAGIRYRETGNLLIHVFSPARAGHAAARATAKTVRNAMRGQDIAGATARVRTGAVDPPEPGTINDGVWSTVTVSVAFASDIIA